MSHLTEHELGRWRDVGSDEHRSRIVEHLAACRSCAARYAELVRRAVPEKSNSSFDVAEFVSAGYRTAARVSAGGAKWRWISAAAAAVLLIGLAVPRMFDSLGADPADSVRRGGSLEAVRPSGVVDTPYTFQWKNGRDDATYLLEIFDGRRVLVFSKKLEQATLRSTELDGALVAGSRYAWMVSIIDSNGNPLSTSSLMRFQIARPE